MITAKVEEIKISNGNKILIGVDYKKNGDLIQDRTFFTYSFLQIAELDNEELKKKIEKDISDYCKIIINVIYGKLGGSVEKETAESLKDILPARLSALDSVLKDVTVSVENQILDLDLDGDGIKDAKWQIDENGSIKKEPL